eukprot:TRINITY_DN40742_c0_g1_i1.p1 TRINITY_DN40742_c0_g1~~TRINITY_DN40742_c0_g1_i1.p1  ORF type:complete len:889 (+),score=240.47 TRINITY_DN40742_c0_g1_i1:62-2668(+)
MATSPEVDLKTSTKSSPVDTPSSPKVADAGKKEVGAAQMAALKMRRISQTLTASKTALARVKTAGAIQDDLESIVEPLMSELITTSKMGNVLEKHRRRLASLEVEVEDLKMGIKEQESHRRAAILATQESDKALHRTVERLATSKPLETGHGGLGASKANTRVEELWTRVDMHDEELKQKEEAIESVAKGVTSAGQRSEEIYAILTQKLQDAAQQASKEAAEEHAERVKKEDELSAELAQARVSMKEMEQRLEAFAKAEARRATRECLFTESGPDNAPPRPPTPYTTGGKKEEKPPEENTRQANFLAAASWGVSGSRFVQPEEWRRALLNVVESGLVVSVREEMAKMKRHFDKQKEELDRKLRASDKIHSELSQKVTKTGKDLQKEADNRLKDQMMSKEEIERVYEAIDGVKDFTQEKHKEALACTGNVETSVTHLNAKVAGHTKDILNSATVSDAKTLADSIHRCATKEAAKKDVSNLKEVLDYAQERIDKLEMQVATMGPSMGKSAHGKGKKGVKRKKVHGKQAMQRDASAASTTVGHASLESLAESGGKSDEEEESSSTAGERPVADPEDQEGFDGEDSEAEASQSEKAVRILPDHRPVDVKARVTQEEEEEDEDEEDDEFGEEDEDSESDSPGELQLREQVRGCCMGLVCLAQHVLRGPPQVGLSRQNRLLNEKELLEELMNLREWITQRHMPADWSIDRLVSVSLRYSHPNPAEVHGPQPEMVHVLRCGSAPQADTRGLKSREKSATSSEGGTFLSKGGSAGSAMTTTVGSIGIDGGFGSNPGGGLGIVGGEMRDSSVMAISLPIMEGGFITSTSSEGKVMAFPSMTPRGAKRSFLSARGALSAREQRASMAQTLPPLSLQPG